MFNPKRGLINFVLMRILGVDNPSGWLGSERGVDAQQPAHRDARRRRHDAVKRGRRLWIAKLRFPWRGIIFAIMLAR